MAESKRINTCQQCLDEFCRNCSDADYRDDFCSKECQDKYYREQDAAEADENDVEN